jgi:very-short-patch-repair endonuclease
MSGDPLFLALLKRERLPAPVPEFRFHPTRKWRTDYAWPLAKVALEVEGGIFTGGRHSRGAGMLKDMEKYNELARMGWRLLRIPPSGLHDLATIELIAATLTPA